MPLKRLLVITAVFFATLLSLTRLLHTASATPLVTTLLYDSSQSNTPSDQNFSYQALNPQPPFTTQATQIYSAPITVLNTASQLNDYAGYTVNQPAMPALDRDAGYQLRFDMRLISEDHSGNNNRAGFNVILLSEDVYGVEMAFWENEIWVQEGNGADLFTQAEGTLFNTTNTLTNYALTVISNTYLLAANGMPLLSGNLRQYTDWEPPSMILPDPYEQPNQLFLGDDTSSAGAEVWLGDVAIETEIAPTISVEQTAVSLPEATTQTTFIIDLNTQSPITATVQYSLTSGTAVAGEDFVASSGTLTFTPGSLSENVQITLLPDDLPEPNETFSLQLFNAVNGVLGVDTAVFTIQDDDAADFLLFLPAISKP
ncbi:Calx-beta domain-containing protein [Candidatus Leptofilum sp.]|uniref:choice-of-anchor Y domain-containing protein n=1 Tax=Candidatus Leptofilum sp. TaxID=3241576 RepID=UPI003B5BA96A